MKEWTEQREQEIQTRALTTADDDMVERAARAFYEYPMRVLDASLRTSWDRLATVCPEVADNHRAHMRAVLDAALGAGEGTTGYTLRTIH